MSPYERMLSILGQTVQDFQSAMTSPVLVDAGSQGKMHRLPKQDVYHAILLKLVTMVSALNAAHILLQAGHVMEQGALQRVADEAREDVTFLVFSVTEGTNTDLHDRFLAAFWAEEFSDFDDALGSHKARDMVPRKKIRAYVTSFIPDPSTATQAGKVVTSAASGYIHAAAPHIMELYMPDKNLFSVTGMSGTPRHAGYMRDFWNYVYRGTVATMLAAKAFGSQSHVDRLTEALASFRAATGRIV